MSDFEDRSERVQELMKEIAEEVDQDSQDAFEMNNVTIETEESQFKVKLEMRKASIEDDYYGWN